MLHGRHDHNERIIDTAGLIPAEEPVFLLRAQDQVAAAAVRAWAHLHRANGGSDVPYALAMAHADRMEQWQRLHGCKAADVPADL